MSSSRLGFALKNSGKPPTLFYIPLMLRLADEDVGDCINQRRSEEPPATWKVIASELGMTICQLDYWRRKHGWVDGHPIVKRRFAQEIRDDEVENALNRGLSANLPLTTILQLMPVEMDRHRLWRWRRDHDYVDPRERVRGSDLDSIFVIL